MDERAVVPMDFWPFAIGNESAATMSESESDSEDDEQDDVTKIIDLVRIK